jgi:hypothetical protein
MKNLPEEHRLMVFENRALKRDEVAESGEKCIITSLIICIL